MASEPWVYVTAPISLREFHEGVRQSFLTHPLFGDESGKYEGIREHYEAIEDEI
jgi:hypothetical protein